MRFILLAALLLLGPLASAQEHGTAGLTPPKYPGGRCPDPKKLRDIHEKLAAKKDLSPDELTFLSSVAKGIEGCPTAFEAEDVVALMHWLQVLPCDPAKIEKPVTLRLVGEGHSNPNKEAYLHYLAKMKAGQALLAYEAILDRAGRVDLSTLTAGESKRVLTNADGIEPVLAYLLDLSDSRGDVSGKQEKRASPTGLALSVFYTLLTSNEASRLFETGIERLNKADVVKGKSAAEAFRLAVDFLEKKKPSIDDFRRNARSFAADYLKELRGAGSDEEAATKLNDLIVAALDVLKGRMADQRFRFRNHAPILEPKTLPRFALSGIEILQHWRDRNLAHAMLRLACDAAREGIGEVVLHLGKEHNPGVFRNISAALKVSGASDKISVLVEDSVLLPVDVKDPDSIPQKNRYHFKAN